MSPLALCTAMDPTLLNELQYDESAGPTLSNGTPCCKTLIFRHLCYDRINACAERFLKPPNVLALLDKAGS